MLSARPPGTSREMNIPGTFSSPYTHTEYSSKTRSPHATDVLGYGTGPNSASGITQKKVPVSVLDVRCCLAGPFYRSPAPTCYGFGSGSS